MKKAIIFFTILLICATLHAQQKFALVIGNGAYNGISRLNNPVNDANDMETALRGLGFTVDKVLNGNLERMESAVMDLKRRLGASRNSYGFFFYAGHGVQAGGENYLIPVEAANIHNDTHLRTRAVSLQFVLDSLNEAGNELNMVVLDACRDNPFSWNRSGSRGLSVINAAPAGSIVMYATSANAVASDGTGRNGIFTGQLLNNLKASGLSVYDVFDKTMEDVIRVSNGRQHPELSLRFPGATRAFLGTRPAPAQPAAATQTTQPAQPQQTQPATTTVQPTQPQQTQPAAATQRPAQPATGLAYKIGDRGPGGGIIFYVSAEGFTVEGYSGTTGSFTSYKAHYLEAAPQNSGAAQWGAKNTFISGVTSTWSNVDAAKKIGNGRKDTLTIMANLGRREKNRAAQLAVATNFGGKNDWFLPSREELNLLYDQRNLTGIGITSGWFWSSSQHSTDEAWGQHFSSGGQGYSGKYGTGSVRAVRAF